MSLLLDTHVFAWWLLGDQRLVAKAKLAIEQNPARTYVSAISGYEMAQKYRLGRWPEMAPLVEGFGRLAAAANFTLLDVTPQHAVRAGLLAGDHRDPFDRLLAAQAIVEGLRIVSGDGALQRLGVEPLWN